MNRNLKTYLVVSLYAAADVGTLFVLSAWIGITWTLLLVVASTILGLFSCRQLWSRFARNCEEQLKQHGLPPPEQIKLYLGAEAALILISMGFFIFPGLLSDVLAYVILIPVVRNRLKDFVMKVQHRQREENAFKQAQKDG